MAKSKILRTEVSHFSTNPPFNRRHGATLLKMYTRIFNNAADFFTRQRTSIPRQLCETDEVAFQAFVDAFVNDYGVANLLAAIAANFHDRAEPLLKLASDKARVARHELTMWAHRIEALAHELHADDAKRDIAE